MKSVNQSAMMWLLPLVVLTTIGANAQTLVQSIRLPSTTYWDQAYGLSPTSGGARLFINSGTTSTVYNRGFIYSLDSLGNRIDSVATGLSSSQGLAWDGTNYWYIRGSGSSAKIFKVTVAGGIVDSIVPPSSLQYMGGACWDGTGLWVSNYFPNNLAALYKYNVATKTIVDTIRVLGLQPQGVAWDGRYFYYAMDNNDADLEKIYQVDPSTKDTVRSWFLPEGPTSNMSPRGLAWDGSYLWLVAEPVGASSGRSLYKYDLSGVGTAGISIPTRFYDLGRIRIGNNAVASPTIQSIGTAALRIDSVKILYSSNYTTNLVTPQTIPQGSSVGFNITFTPTQFGVDSAQVVIYHNDPARPPQIVRVTGMGIYPAAHISIPGSYSYGSRRVSSTNSYTLRVENQGATALTITSASFGSPRFYVQAGTFPLTVDSVNYKNVRVWFNPTSATAYADTMRISSNASNGSIVNVALSGTGDATPIPIGVPLWNYTVPDHPVSNTGRLVKAVRAISDITGDGKPEVVVSTENYWTMALNGNASVATDSLWSFTSYISNNSAGSIGTTGDYSHQKALGVASDLNNDGFKDVVIVTGGGNEHVYALNGRTGQMLWTFGTDAADSFGLGDFTGVDVSTDYNNDGVPDVIAAAAATQSGGIGPRQRVYLFNGATGSILWQAPLIGFTHGVAAIGDINGDGKPDVIGCVGEPSYKASAFSGTNGALIWDFAIGSTSSGGKEVMAWPVQGQTPDVIIGSFWGPVYRVDGETGLQMWSRPTGGSGVMQLARLKDVTGDGIDEVLAALLGGGAYCINGANGNIVWSLPTGNTMGIAAIPDLNQDSFDDVAIAVQNQGAMIVKGQDGVQLALYNMGGNQSREVAIVPDMDGNSSWEIISCSNLGHVALISGGLNAGPTSVGDQGSLPREFSLNQNYPNPFNPTTTIEVVLPEQSNISLTIYDLLGRKIKSFENERVPTGVHSIVWDGTSSSGSAVSSGVYFYQLHAGNQVFTRRMMLLK